MCLHGRMDGSPYVGTSFSVYFVLEAVKNYALSGVRNGRLTSLDRVNFRYFWFEADKEFVSAQHLDVNKNFSVVDEYPQLAFDRLNVFDAKLVDRSVEYERTALNLTAVDAIK